MVAANTHAEPRWRRLPEERPRQILEAALDVFGEHGLAAARLDDIARRAGVSKGTIYLYFPNKEALFCEMLRQGAGRNIEEAEQRSSADATATERLRAYMRDAWEYVRSPTFERLYRLTMSELHHFPHLLQFFLEEVVMRSMRVVSAIVRDGIAAGEFRDVDPDVAARLLHALFSKHGIWCAQRERIPFLANVSDADVLGQMMDFYLHAIQLSPAAAGVHTKVRS